ncbi:hypothetical protein FC35_GL000892 [Limosilactobacillus coleohominis DSM 14060]|nr:hypothetical protein FC35_GL000892 [Limosilactobacillus coleohominis DSM 14060]
MKQEFKGKINQFQVTSGGAVKVVLLADTTDVDLNNLSEIKKIGDVKVNVENLQAELIDDDQVTDGQTEMIDEDSKVSEEAVGDDD